MSKKVNLNFQFLINGWDIEIIDGSKTIDFSASESFNKSKDPNFESLSSRLSMMSYKLNKDLMDSQDDDDDDDDESVFCTDDIEIDEHDVELIVKDYFKDDTLEVNVRYSKCDT